MKLVDKEKVVAAIKKLYKEDYRFLPSDIVESVGDFKDDLLMILDNLSTVKVVDLEKELKTLDDTLFDLDGVAVQGTTSYLTVNDVKDIAKHFFELGLKMKGE